MIARALALWLALVAALAPPSARASEVDLQLILAVDCSGSIDNSEFLLQIQGYAAALTHPAVVKAILSGPAGAIALTYVQWSGPFLQQQTVPWTRIDSAQAAEAFGDRLLEAPRRIFGGGTSLSGIIDYGAREFDRSGFRGGRRVIDISGDGINNVGRQPQSARDDAVARGVTINGLAILTDIAGLDRYFEEYVIGGPGAFVMAVPDFQVFAQSIFNKLFREVAGAPYDGPAVAQVPADDAR